MKKLIFTFLGFYLLGIFTQPLLAQQPLIGTYQFDESNLYYTSSGGTLVNDVGASGGKAMYQPISAIGTFWFGPYQHINGGLYTVSFRLKVGSNLSNSNLCTLDIVGQAGAQYLKGFSLKPSMFKNVNEWQVISFSIELPEGVNDVEIRCVGFQPNITDLYLDYILLRPFDIQGYYSNSISIESGGNIGIGTNSPDEKLTVKGKIHAEEVRVDLSVPGPDYVFEKDYPLQSLAETQKYIQENKHLPEVPSAKEMEDKGINLSEMNMLLLKKVEELTLHLIEKEKQIDYLIQKDKKTDLLTNKLKQLEDEIKRKKN